EVILKGKLDTETIGVPLGTALTSEEMANSNFIVREKETTDALAGTIMSEIFYSKSQLWFIPENALLTSKAYEIVLKGYIDEANTGLMSITNGVLQSGEASICADKSNNQRCVKEFPTVASGSIEQCKLTHLEINPNAPVYTCAGNACNGDQDSANEHQRIFTAVGINKAGQIADPDNVVVWQSSDIGILSSATKTDAEVNEDIQQLFAIKGVNGSANISANAGGITGSTEVRVFICENPWPASMIENGKAWNDTNLTYSNTTKDIRTNFSMFYCKDNGQSILPNLDMKVEVGIDDVGDGPNDLRSVQGLLKELFFIPEGLDDAIGIRVLQNAKNQSVQEWYNNQEFTKGSPKKISIHGFDALQDGRTIYVSAINDTKAIVPSIYNNIYLISINDNANEDSINIYNQLVENWRFLVNIEDTDEQNKLRRDLKRIEDANTVKQVLDAKYPAVKLESGSFKKGFSASTWPSWQAGLSADLGIQMPKDPVQSDPDKNVINCADNLQPTCWNGTDFSCIGNFADGRKSTFYRYEYTTENQAIFRMNLEYSNENWGNIIQGDGWSLPDGNSCYNIQYTKQY
ncbi:MAG: hypothetical protein COV79_02805, partial [Parcubacteria group bacterium CG11_big_fil_rev_8_21_14_0_20_41_14]